MSKVFAVACSFGAFAVGATTEAQDSARTICDPAEPWTECPGPDCLCIGDRLEVTFAANGASELHLDPFSPQSSVDVAVILDTKSDGIEAWSYGVAHDPAFLEIDSVTIDGTAAVSARQDGFVVLAHERIEDCGEVAEPQCINPPPGHGFISGIILSFTRPLVLPLGRNELARARYHAMAAPGNPGTRLQLTSSLRQRHGLRADIVLTWMGTTRRPGQVVDALLTSPGTVQGFRRGDADRSGDVTLNDAVSSLEVLFLGTAEPSCLDILDANDDGLINIVDPAFILQGLYRGGRDPPEPFQECGEDATPDALTCQLLGPCA